MSQFKVRYEPPRGYPLGTNITFKICANIIIPIFNLFMKRDWKGAQNIPAQGRVIVASNHMSYLDVLVFTHFLYRNGRAPRYLGKSGVFKVRLLERSFLQLDKFQLSAKVRMLRRLSITQGLFSSKVTCSVSTLKEP